MTSRLTITVLLCSCLLLSCSAERSGESSDSASPGQSWSTHLVAFAVIVVTVLGGLLFVCDCCKKHGNGDDQRRALVTHDELDEETRRSAAATVRPNYDSFSDNTVREVDSQRNTEKRHDDQPGEKTGLLQVGPTARVSATAPTQVRSEKAEAAVGRSPSATGFDELVESRARQAAAKSARSEPEADEFDQLAQRRAHGAPQTGGISCPPVTAVGQSRSAGDRQHVEREVAKQSPDEALFDQLAQRHASVKPKPTEKSDSESARPAQAVGRVTQSQENKKQQVP